MATHNQYWARPPWKNFPLNQHRPININFTSLIICNFPHQPRRSPHENFAFMIPVLLGFLQIQTMGNQPSPFQVNPVTNMASVISIVAYYLAFRATLRFPTYASQLAVVMAASGSLSVASLVYLLLPHSWWCFKYIFFVLLVVSELHPTVQNLYCSYVKGFNYKRSPPNTRRVPSLLPQTLMDLAHDWD